MFCPKNYLCLMKSSAARERVLMTGEDSTHGCKCVELWLRCHEGECYSRERSRNKIEEKERSGDQKVESLNL